ncbi:MAG TPA: carbohydrate ABC transporter permease [Ktedonobacteraceae bacterium]|nr:carbohydrate ABC transporter permease [Ktedonobacteraceae bacterium]
MNTPQSHPLRMSLKYLFLALLAIAFLFPFAWMVSTSLKTNTEALLYPTRLLPAVPQWSNYPNVIEALNFWRELFNSLVMSLGVTFGTIILSALAGYAFARLKFFGSDALFLLILATLIIPFQILFVPLYLMLANWGGWLNTFYALIIPSLASPFAIFVFRQFFITIPKDLDEAAKIDGAGYYRIFFRIMMPLAGPAVATVFILTFLAEWSNLLKPLVFTSSPDLYTLQQGLAVTLNRGANLVPNLGTLMAGVVLASILPVAMFLIGQRYFVRSVASTGLKG